MKDGKIFKVAFITRWDESNACWRLQQHAIIRGSSQTPGLICEIFNPLQSDNISEFHPDFIAFHFGEGGIDTIQKLHKLCPNSHFVCFGSDIYDFGLYTRFEPVTDLFVMPTRLHKQVLSAHVHAPVYELAEPVDPLVRSSSGQDFGIRRGRRIGWFGYAESFYKSMYSLLPVIRSHLERKTIDSFSILTDPNQFPNYDNFFVMPFNSLTFASEIKSFDYVILSHFPLDLHINSLIKSPNKAMTALAANTIPLASDTPAYRDLFQELGIVNFLFDSPTSLDRLLKNIDPERDSALLRSCSALDNLLTKYTDERVANDFRAILNRYLSSTASYCSRSLERNSTSYLEFARASSRPKSRALRAMRALFR